MKLHPNLQTLFSKDRFNAVQAQQMAYLIAFGPSVFQTARLMLHYGILEMLQNEKEGLTQQEVVKKTGLSEYAVKCLLEASLTMGVLLLDMQTERYKLSKIGWFLLNDKMIRVDIDFNHDVNYEGWFVLDKALETGKPAGLKHFGDWPTIYEGLSQLPPQVQKSWFGFDHYYSDNSFEDALDLIFGKEGGVGITGRKVNTLLDVGGNTGRFALRVVEHNKQVEVTICDLPQQIAMMHHATNGKPGAERISGYGMNLLEQTQTFPTDRHYDIIWMSQFLDCFGEEDITNILSRADKIMDNNSRLLIMETLWDRQPYAPAAMALTQTSLYFTALANGNSKMYNTDDMTRLIEDAGLIIDTIHDNIGKGGHSLLVCKKKRS